MNRQLAQAEAAKKGADESGATGQGEDAQRLGGAGRARVSSAREAPRRMTTLDVTTNERARRACTCELSGELDLAAAPKLEDELRRGRGTQPGADRARPARRSRSWTRAGCARCSAADARAREAGRRLVLVRGDERVQRVLRITRLDERLEIVDDVDAVARRLARRR